MPSSNLCGLATRRGFLLYTTVEAGETHAVGVQITDRRPRALRQAVQNIGASNGTPYYDRSNVSYKTSSATHRNRNCVADARSLH